MLAAPTVTDTSDRRDSVMPTHEHRCFVVFLGESQLAPQFPVRRVEHLVLCVGDLKFRQVERFRYGHPVDGPFVEIAVVEAGR